VRENVSRVRRRFSDSIRYNRCWYRAFNVTAFGGTSGVPLATHERIAASRALVTSTRAWAMSRGLCGSGFPGAGREASCLVARPGSVVDRVPASRDAQPATTTVKATAILLLAQGINRRNSDSCGLRRCGCEPVRYFDHRFEQP